MKIIIEGSSEEILDLVSAGKSNDKGVKPVFDFSMLTGFCRHEDIPSHSPAEKNIRGKVTPYGLRIGKKFYTFEKGYDMWRYLGEELIVINNFVYDKSGNNLGKLIRI